MKCLTVAVALVTLGVTLAAEVYGQGYYQRNVQRNPITGRLEVVPGPGSYGSAYGPNRNYGDFYGTRFNPYSGTATQSRVQRNPITGRLDVANEYYNPWTGAKMETVTRYNPATRRYETIQMVTPPNRLPAQDQPEQNAPASENSSRTKPRVIETAPPPSLEPPLVDADGTN